MRNPFPYSIKYILTCYAVDVLAVFATVVVAHFMGFNASDEWMKVHT